MKHITALVFAAALGCVQPISATPTPLIDFTGGFVEPNASDVTYGYSFTITGMSYEITGLGAFESFSQSLSLAHEVGVWDAGGTLLASAIVGGGNPIVASSDALGQWRVADVTPLVLGPGTYYAGVYYPSNSELVLLGAVTPVALPGITYNSSQYRFGFALDFPSSGFGSDALIGPVLIGETAGPSGEVPEPATLALLGAGIFLVSRRKARKA